MVRRLLGRRHGEDHHGVDSTGGRPPPRTDHLPDLRGALAARPRRRPVGAVLNRVPKYVATTTLNTVEWNNSTLLQGDVPRAVAALKDERSGEIQVHGSWGLLQTLIEHDLIDEYRLWTFQVLLGSGKRLFDTGTIPAGLELIDSTTSSNSKVAFVVDDMASVDPWRPRAVMVQGRAEALEGQASKFAGSDDAIIRIAPDKIVSWGLDEGTG